MIVIQLDDAGERHLMDREALAEWLDVAVITIRRRCKPVDKDPKRGALLYDAEACYDQLAAARQLTKRPTAMDRMSIPA